MNIFKGCTWEINSEFRKPNCDQIQKRRAHLIEAPRERLYPFRYKEVKKVKNKSKKKSEKLKIGKRK